MSEADRVFPRREDHAAKPAVGEKRFIQTSPRKTGQSRAVEVVHVNRGSGKPTEDRPRPAPWSVRAESWPDGFRARPRIQPAEFATPPAKPAEAPAQIGHVITRQTTPAAIAEPMAPAAAPPRRKPAATEKERHFADPFSADDSGANCLRCGYLVEPAREKRGELTCAACG